MSAVRKSAKTPQVKNETVFKRHFAVAGNLRAPRVRRGSRGERKAGLQCRQGEHKASLQADTPSTRLVCSADAPDPEDW